MKSLKHPKDLSISEFSYDLPQDKIAVYPLKERDSSKLLVFKNQKIQTEVFRNLVQHLPYDSCLVFNSTKVIPARLYFRSQKNKLIEVFCLEPTDKTIEISFAMQSTAGIRLNCLVGNLKQWKEEELVAERENLHLKAKISHKHITHVELEFSWIPEQLTFVEVLQQLGEVPIPPYLNRESVDSDNSNYQTVYARKSGSVAAPTAGLHFTPAVMEQLSARSIPSFFLTLHVGAGTFKPVKSEFMQEHHMHAEWFEVDRGLIEGLLNLKEKKIIPVGTTSLRTLESLYWMGVKLCHNPNLSIKELEITQWEAYEIAANGFSVEKSLGALLDWMSKHGLHQLVCQTQILIAPPYELKIASGIVTNFHQPKSTLLLLIAAVIGDDWKKVYAYALENDFRFLSYGDSSLLLK